MQHRKKQLRLLFLCLPYECAMHFAAQAIKLQRFNPKVMP